MQSRLSQTKTVLVPFLSDIFLTLPATTIIFQMVTFFWIFHPFLLYNPRGNIFQ